MIDNFSGIDTEGGRGGGGGDIMVFAIECMQDYSFLFLKDRSSLQYFITLILGGGLGLWEGEEEGEEES